MKNRFIYAVIQLKDCHLLGVFTSMMKAYHFAVKQELACQVLKVELNVATDCRW